MPRSLRWKMVMQKLFGCSNSSWIITSYENIINIYQKSSKGLTSFAGEQGIISTRLYISSIANCFWKLCKPLARCLFQPV
jgi:hypothetical protein